MKSYQISVRGKKLNGRASVINIRRFEEGSSLRRKEAGDREQSSGVFAGFLHSLV